MHWKAAAKTTQIQIVTTHPTISSIVNLPNTKVGCYKVYDRPRAWRLFGLAPCSHDAQLCDDKRW